MLTGSIVTKYAIQKEYNHYGYAPYFMWQKKLFLIHKILMIDI